MVLLDLKHVQVGQSSHLDDFQWAYLDYHSFANKKIFLERPTPMILGTFWQSNLPRKTALTPQQRAVNSISRCAALALPDAAGISRLVVTWIMALAITNLSQDELTFSDVMGYYVVSETPSFKDYGKDIIC